MKAGRQLDALVAEKVMGWELTQSRLGHYHVITSPSGKPIKTHSHIPLFSTDIAAAWLVVEKLITDGYEVSIDSIIDGFFECGINKDDGEIDARIIGWEREAPTAALAICLAVLEAVK